MKPVSSCSLPVLVGFLGLLAACESFPDRPEVGAEPWVRSPAAQNVLDYLRSEEGRTILAGQMNLTWDQGVDMVDRVYKTTGRYPALQGFDFLNIEDRTGVHPNPNNQTKLALEWWNDARGTGHHGLVTFCWHWRDPSRATDRFYRTKADGSGAGPGLHIPLDKNKNFDPTTDLGRQMVADMDLVATELAVLRDAGVPVLWRPFHEAGGTGKSDGSEAWFWWGQDGADASVALFRWMHEYYTQEKKLNNLIWVWNGQGRSWYPGSSFVDVAGWDIYEQNHSSQWNVAQTLGKIAPGKLVALSEVGALPDPALLAKDGAPWVWFLVWNDTPLIARGKAKENFWSGSGAKVENETAYPWNTPTFARDIYGHPRVITLDELPSLMP